MRGWSFLSFIRKQFFLQAVLNTLKVDVDTSNKKYWTTSLLLPFLKSLLLSLFHYIFTTSGRNSTFLPLVLIIYRLNCLNDLPGNCHYDKTIRFSVTSSHFSILIMRPILHWLT